MWLDCENSGGGGGGGASIEYVGEFTSGSGATSAKSIDFKTGTYARSDYADLTTDNFLVLPVRSTTQKSTSTSKVTGNTAQWYSSAYVANKNHEYTASTGTFKFYGGFGAEMFAGSTSRGTSNSTINYKVYVIKPGISTFES